MLSYHSSILLALDLLFFLAIYNGVVSGIKCVVFSAIGNVVGLMCWSILSVTGLSAILLASSTLFLMVKMIGACYFFYLGLKQIRFNKKSIEHSSQTIVNKQRSLFSYVKEGFFVAVTNLKPIIFFTAFFPQFLDTDQPLFFQFSVMTLTLMFMFFSFLSLSTYGYLAQKAKGFFIWCRQCKVVSSC